MTTKHRIARRLGKNRGGVKRWAKAHEGRRARRLLNGTSRTARFIG